MGTDVYKWMLTCIYLFICDRLLRIVIHAGHYCPDGSTTATQFPCPIGKYGDQEGLTNSDCSGLCKTNNYCGRGTINQFAHPV